MDGMADFPCEAKGRAPEPHLHRMRQPAYARSRVELSQVTHQVAAFSTFSWFLSGPSHGADARVPSYPGRVGCASVVRGRHGRKSATGQVGTLRYRIGTQRQLLAGALALRRALTSGDATGVVDASFSISPGEWSVAPVQIRSELIRFLSLIEAERPRHVLEVGTANGGMLYLLCWAARRDARVLSLDIRELPRVRRLFRQTFLGRRRHVEIWTADSHSEKTRAAVERFFGGHRIDVLFIDGDHSYDGVGRDYELYAPLVRPGGLIAFHDIVDGPESAVGGVPDFWRSVRSSLDAPHELVEDWSQGGYGIGVGRVPGPGAVTAR